MNARCPASGVRARRSGAASIEFQIISIMVLIPMLMGVLQMGLLVVAKNTINVATLAAARAGAASGGDKGAMKHALALGLAPLHVATGKRLSGVGMGDITSANYAAVMGGALATSKLSTAAFGKIQVLNPTAKSFKDFGFNKPKVGLIIPVTGVLDNNAVGGTSKQTRAEALLLKIQVTYCYKMDVPVIDEIIQTVMLRWDSGASFDERACYLLKRVPINSQAVVRMTVPPVQKALL